MTVFIQKGDAPLSVRQAEKKGRRILDLQVKPYEREVGAAIPTDEYLAFVQGWVADNQVNAMNNLFNHQLAAYRAAQARLARYRLADGQPEITEDQPTGETDDEGNQITQRVVIQPAFEPLDPADPAIVTDDAERAAAKAIVDGTPQEVRDFGE